MCAPIPKFLGLAALLLVLSACRGPQVATSQATSLDQCLALAALLSEGSDNGPPRSEEAAELLNEARIKLSEFNTKAATEHFASSYAKMPSKEALLGAARGLSALRCDTQAKEAFSKAFRQYRRDLSPPEETEAVSAMQLPHVVHRNGQLCILRTLVPMEKPIDLFLLPDTALVQNAALTKGRCADDVYLAVSLDLPTTAEKFLVTENATDQLVVRMNDRDLIKTTLGQLSGYQQHEDAARKRIEERKQQAARELAAEEERRREAEAIATRERHARACEHVSSHKEKKDLEKLKDSSTICPEKLTDTQKEWLAAYEKGLEIGRRFQVVQSGTSKDMERFYNEYYDTGDARVEELRKLAESKFGPPNPAKFKSMRRSLEATSTPSFSVTLCDIVGDTAKVELSITNNTAVVGLGALLTGNSDVLSKAAKAQQISQDSTIKNAGRITGAKKVELYSTCISPHWYLSDRPWPPKKGPKK